MIRSPHVADLLDRYRTGELPALEAGRVKEHLSACPACARRLTEIEALAADVARGYRAWKVDAEARAPTPADLRASVLARIARPAGGGPPPVRTPGWGWLTVPRLVPGLGMAAVAVLAFGVLLRQQIRSPADAELGLRKPSAAAPQRDEAPSAILVPRDGVDQA
nr:zf-HC2 domain-containing protein [Gemmatimonadota bacterium]